MIHRSHPASYGANAGPIIAASLRTQRQKRSMDARKQEVQPRQAMKTSQPVLTKTIRAELPASYDFSRNAQSP